MSDATLRCPGCGAPADADAAKCQYCGAGLATVTCPSCFAPMFAGSRFCPRCGADASARQAEDDDHLLNCPRCAEPLQALRLGATSVHECMACGGLWLTPNTLQQLTDAREEHTGVVATLKSRTPAATVAQETVRYVPCPRCRKLMNRVNFARSSGVVVDVCKHDGVWLDRGELERVVGFVEQGGLSSARRHEREQLEAERKRLDAAKSAGTVDLHDFRGLTPGLMHDATPASPVERLLQDALGLFLRP